MQLRCPHCHHGVEIVGSGAFDSIECPSCGSAFDLLMESAAATAEKRQIGRFELIEPVGAGSFGTVWKARDTELDRLVAIKLPHFNRSDINRGEQFLREAQAAAGLKHPHIVAVHEVGRDGAQHT
jgi:serine/threonine protein kinase